MFLFHCKINQATNYLISLSSNKIYSNDSYREDKNLNLEESKKKKRQKILQAIKEILIPNDQSIFF